MSAAETAGTATAAEFGDVTPVPQYDDSSAPPVCAIAYSPKFLELMSVFRAILAADERSPRALRLTSSVIALNNANYTAWHFRRKVIDTLYPPSHPSHRDTWVSELQFAAEIAEENPKNYQLWYHRQAALARLDDPQSYREELVFCDRVLVQGEDAKNYHAHSHRQWVADRLGVACWKEEVEWAAGLIERDVRNNSAWNHRWVALHKTEGGSGLDHEREMEFVVARISRAPNNESPWVYLRGLVDERPELLRDRVVAMAEEYERKFPACAHALSLLADMYEESGNSEGRVRVLTKLRDSVDPVRRKYWDWLLGNIEKRP